MELFKEHRLPPKTIILKSGPVDVPKFSWLFQPWRGPMPDYKFGDGNKPVLEWENTAAYAELALISILKRHGFTEAIWRDNFGPGYFREEMPPKECDPPEHIREVYERIVAVNGKPGGCWDVLAWNPKAVMLVECKRKGEDDIKSRQIKWLESALEAGFSVHNFAICEWTLGS